MPNRNYVLAKDAVLYMYKDGDYRRFACVFGLTLSMDTEAIETTAPGDGAWRDYESSNANGFTLHIDLITVLQDAIDDLWFTWETLLQQIRSAKQDLKLVWTDKAGNTKYAAFQGVIIHTGFDGTTGDFEFSDIAIQGAGKFDIQGLLNTTQQKVRRKEWITTGSEPNVVQDNDLIGRQMKYVNWEANDKYTFITVGTPNEMQVLFNSATGSLTFKNNFGIGDFIYCLYE